MQFSPNGNYIAISTNENHILVLDSFSGEIKNTFTNYTNCVNFILKSF